jgi:hypothetical protein
MYNVVRFYVDGWNEMVLEGITLAEARAHCSSPESSKAGEWFDGYEES